ncbi:hypothetical protein UFOVP23_44 [uncultured Caudovirales phage]|uniref:Uncharacterized protein n=1 Tax=uncultured Caudovirales phage TaxID=2100421 RepID=A0A6J5TAT1_9CAUD|nr:hypothetical protein UFOVP23_44 [uncultured Caudovirales phage]
MSSYSNALGFPGLTTKASPTLSDIILISDAAAGGALKQTTLSDLPFSAPVGANVVNVTTSTQAMAINTIYFVNYGGGVCTLTLPLAASAMQGGYVQIIGGESVSNAWVIAQNASQFIRQIDSVTTTTSGTLTANNKFNSLIIMCSATSGGLSWSVLSPNGSFTGS